MQCLSDVPTKPLNAPLQEVLSSGPQERQRAKSIQRHLEAQSKGHQPRQHQGRPPLPLVQLQPQQRQVFEVACLKSEVDHLKRDIENDKRENQHIRQKLVDALGLIRLRDEQILKLENDSLKQKNQDAIDQGTCGDCNKKLYSCNKQLAVARRETTNWKRVSCVLGAFILFYPAFFYLYYYRDNVHCPCPIYTTTLHIKNIGDGTSSDSLSFTKQNEATSTRGPVSAFSDAADPMPAVSVPPSNVTSKVVRRNGPSYRPSILPTVISIAKRQICQLGSEHWYQQNWIPSEGRPSSQQVSFPSEGTSSKSGSKMLCVSASTKMENKAPPSNASWGGEQQTEYIATLGNNTTRVKVIENDVISPDPLDIWSIFSPRPKSICEIKSESNAIAYAQNAELCATDSLTYTSANAMFCRSSAVITCVIPDPIENTVLKLSINTSSPYQTHFTYSMPSSGQRSLQLSHVVEEPTTLSESQLSLFVDSLSTGPGNALISESHNIGTSGRTLNWTIGSGTFSRRFAAITSDKGTSNLYDSYSFAHRRTAGNGELVLSTFGTTDGNYTALTILSGSLGSGTGGNFLIAGHSGNTTIAGLAVCHAFPGSVKTVSFPSMSSLAGVIDSSTLIAASSSLVASGALTLESGNTNKTRDSVGLPGGNDSSSIKAFVTAGSGGDLSPRSSSIQDVIEQSIFAICSYCLEASSLKSWLEFKSYVFIGFVAIYICCFLRKTRRKNPTKFYITGTNHPALRRVMLRRMDDYLGRSDWKGTKTQLYLVSCHQIDFNLN